MMRAEMPTTARRRSLLGEKIGNYAIVSTLGEGGMGVVYLAEHPILGKRVAIKVLHGDHAARAEAAARCFVEARAAAAIAHPNVVGVIDCGVAEIGGAPVHYLVMEHLEGRSLRDELRGGGGGGGGGALPVARAIAIGLEVGRALAAAHEKGIVHRDIKPENIFLVAGAGEPRPAVKVLDFGVAKLMDGHPFGGPLTQSGVTLGTPTYMAPEQLDDEDIDGRVDVYALGIVLFEMLTGAAPFADEPTARGVWRRMNEVPPLPEALALPGAVEELLLRALDPDRVRRPSMSELVRGLADPEAVEDAAEGAERHTRRVARVKQPERAEREKQPARAKQPERATEPAARAAARPMRWPLIAAIGLVLGAAAAVIVPKLLRDDAPSTSSAASPSPSPLPVAPPPVSAAPPDPATVVIALDTRPSGAEVFVGGERRGTTPARLVLARSAAPVPIVLRRGTAELRHQLDASRDGSFSIVFPVPARPAPAPARDAAVPAASPSTSPDAAVPAPAPAAAPPPPPDAAPPPSGLGDNLLPPRDRR